MHTSMGSNDIILGPGGPTDPLYGLYLPVTDLFLITYFKKNVMQNLRSLLSSKCATCIIELSSAPGYHPKLIDNTVCHNWTIDRHNWGFINFPVDPIILAGSRFGLAQRHESCTIDLSPLLEFAKKSLKLVSRLESIESMPLPDLIHRLGWKVMYPTLSSIGSLDFFHGDLVRSMKDCIEQRLTDLDETRKQAKQTCFEMIYWSKDLDQLARYLQESDNPIIKYINA